MYSEWRKWNKCKSVDKEKVPLIGFKYICPRHPKLGRHMQSYATARLHKGLRLWHCLVSISSYKNHCSLQRNTKPHKCPVCNTAGVTQNIIADFALENILVRSFWNVYASVVASKCRMYLCLHNAEFPFQCFLWEQRYPQSGREWGKWSWWKAIQVL